MKHNLFGDPVLQGFREHLVVQGKSPNTITSYITSVTKYIDWFSSRYGKAPSQLFAENVAEYKEDLNRQNMSAATFNVRMAGLHAWNEYLVANGIQSDKIIRKNDKKKIQQQYASPAIHRRAAFYSVRVGKPKQAGLYAREFTGLHRITN